MINDVLLSISSEDTALFKGMRHRFLTENHAPRGSLSKIWFYPSAKGCIIPLAGFTVMYGRLNCIWIEI